MSQKRGPDRPGPGSKRSRGDPEGLVGGALVPGGIMKIELQNFMCHTFFEVDFCSTVNFIVGRNGSKLDWGPFGFILVFTHNTEY